MRILLSTLFILASFRTYSQDTTRLSLLFLGDVMQHGTQIAAAYNAAEKKYDYSACFRFIKPYIASADVAIGNLEVTLAGPPYQGYPQFSAPDELLVTLKDAGMDVLVTANNHCVDKGRKGLERTIEMLDSFNILHTGTFVGLTDRLNNYPLLIEKNGFKIALLNYTFSTNGLPVTKPNIVNRIDTAVIRQDLRKAKTYKPDAIIVFTHWGIEYQSLPSGEQKMVSEFCFKKGADMVIGAHPHVIQPMEWRKGKNKLIAYSLGNFVSGQRKRYTDGGAMLHVELEKVSYTQDSSTTTIDSAAYMLQYIYKAADTKAYYIMPVTTFERDAKGFIKDAASKEAFKTFIDDSRKLYNAHNILINESHVIPSDSIITYKVLFFTSNNENDNSWSSYASLLYQPVKVKDAQGNFMFLSGDFTSEADARRHQRRLVLAGFKDAVVIKFVNGIKED